MPDKPLEFKESKDEPVKLVFSSKLALMRSIKKKYPNGSKAQWDATFDDQKQFCNVNVEQFLEDKWQKYKKDNGLT